MVWYNAQVRIKLTKKFLEKVYLKQKLSTWGIEKKYGVSRSTVFTALKRFDIPTRTIAQSHILYPRNNFSGDLLEKAYLIGFALGDLRVRNHNKKLSETISIACGSTKQAQIDLIESLFTSYGRVWIGQKNQRGVINIEAFVNKSFDFLLPAERDYQWCSLRKKHFFAFLAGFTDAEGSFFISDGKAFITWGNYNLVVLQFIHAQLISHGIIVPKIYSDKLKGTYDTHGYIRNGTYCHISICRKTEITKTLKMLKPYLKHADKLKRLAVIEENITLRTSL
jgi:hypothetical protein